MRPNNLIMQQFRPISDIDVTDAIIERPYRFTAGGRRFGLYWPSLGVVYLATRLLSGLPSGFRSDEGQILRFCHTDRESADRMAAFATMRRRSDILDGQNVREVQSFLHDNLSEDELALLLKTWFVMADSDSLFVHLGLDKEHKLRDRINSVKKSRSSVTLGGSSIYGSLVDTVCQRYGWTMGYVLWGISYVNLRLLLADSVTSVYLTKEERKKLHLPDDGVTIDGNDPGNRERIRQMLKNG